MSWVELDVHRSSDGALVVRHDPVAPGGGFIVAQSAADLAATGVATLAEVLAALPASIAVNIDVKTIIGDAVDPAQHAVAAAANLGLGAVCLHTGTLNLRRDQMRPMDLSPERIIETAHRAGLEVLSWSPSPAEAVRLAAAGEDAVCVNDIPGVRAALASAAGGG